MEAVEIVRIKDVIIEKVSANDEELETHLWMLKATSGRHETRDEEAT